MIRDAAAGSAAPGRAARLRFGAFELDLATGELRREGAPVKLPPQAFAVLAILASRPAELVTRDEIRERIWGDETFVDFEQGLGKCLYLIRERLGDDPRSPRFIETLPRRGYRFIAPLAEERRRITLLVLPFQNLSGDPEQEYLSDGLTEELIAQLSQLDRDQVGVIARTTAMTYKRRSRSIGQVGEELGVDYVVEGSVRRQEARVRVTAQLIQVADQCHVWAEMFDREVDGILELQRHLAEAIAGEIRVKLPPQGLRRPAAGRSLSHEAYDAYLKGRYHWYNLSPESLEAALACFQLALEHDPGYALAHAGIGEAWGARAYWGLVPPGQGFAKAKQAAWRAVELDDSLAEGHFCLAKVRLYHDWDWAATQAEFQRAIELNRNNLVVRAVYWFFLSSTGRLKQGMGEIDRLLELDPLNFYYQGLYGWHLLHLERYGEAIATLQEALRTEPDFPPAHQGLWGAYHSLGMWAKALAEARRYLSLSGFGEAAEALAPARGEPGYRRAMAAAADVLAGHSARSYVQPTVVARLHAEGGQGDRALDWLERAWAERDPMLVYLRVDWDWRPLRSEARFRELLRRMDLMASGEMVRPNGGAGEDDRP